MAWIPIDIRTMLNDLSHIRPWSILAMRSRARAAALRQIDPENGLPLVSTRPPTIPNGHRSRRRFRPPIDADQ
jgi:hypothetical protein